MRINLCVRGLSVLLAIALTNFSAAALVRYDFEVLNTPGSLGLTGEGYFVFDDSIAPPAPGIDLNDTGLLLDFSFGWNGIDYDETTASSGLARFDDNGTPNELIFGNDCFPGFCGVTTSDEEWALVFDLSGQDGSIVYSVEGVFQFFEADVLLSAPAPVPLAPAAVFMTSAIAGLFGMTRRRSVRAWFAEP